MIHALEFHFEETVKIVFAEFSRSELKRSTNWVNKRLRLKRGQPVCTFTCLRHVTGHASDSQGWAKFC